MYFWSPPRLILRVSATTTTTTTHKNVFARKNEKNSINAPVRKFKYVLFQGPMNDRKKVRFAPYRRFLSLFSKTIFRGDPPRSLYTRGQRHKAKKGNKSKIICFLQAAFARIYTLVYVYDTLYMYIPIYIKHTHTWFIFP